MSNIKHTVITDFEIEGFHNYPNPPKQVDFLKHNHRHLFQIRVGYQVTDTNRELEIFIQQDMVKDYINDSYGVPANFNNMSCEMIALDILEFTKDDGSVFVEVFEDGKGGARAEYDSK